MNPHQPDARDILIARQANGPQRWLELTQMASGQQDAKRIGPSVRWGLCSGGGTTRLLRRDSRRITAAAIAAVIVTAAAGGAIATAATAARSRSEQPRASGGAVTRRGGIRGLGSSRSARRPS